MTNWIAANLVTWVFDVSNLKNVVENTKSGYIYKTTVNGVATAGDGPGPTVPGLAGEWRYPDRHGVGGDGVCDLQQDHPGLPAEGLRRKPLCGPLCGHSRTSATLYCPWPLPDPWPARLERCITCSGNTEFFWSTYQTLPVEGFNGIPVALLAANHPIGVIFTGLFMSMLDVSGSAAEAT